MAVESSMSLKDDRLTSIQIQIGHWNIELPYTEKGIELGRRYIDLIWELERTEEKKKSLFGSDYDQCEEEDPTEGEPNK